MTRRRLAWLVVAVMALALAAGGCRFVKTKIGLGDQVVDPGAGTPEKVIQDVLRAGLEKDEEKAWLMYSKLLESEQVSPASLQNWRQFKLGSLRKKVELYLDDKEKVSYTIDRQVEEEDGSLTIFLRNLKSDMPTPCTVMKDPKANNEWRIKRCSL